MMKNLLGTLALASLATIQIAQADTIGFEIGTYQWNPDYKGSFSATDSGLNGSSINLQDDLGYSDENHNITWLKLEHPIPLLPNVKIVSSNLDASSINSPLSVDIVFNGVSFSAQENVDSTFDLSNTEYTFYYEILDNWINIDIGLTLRKYDGEVSIRSSDNNNINEMEELDFTIPLLYVAARVDLPFTGFFIDAELNTISVSDNSLTDIMVGIGYESEIGLGVKAGYHTFSMDVDEDGFESDLEFDGSYISVFYHF